MYSEKSKIVLCLDSFSKQINNIWVIFRLISVFETTALLNLPFYSVFARSYRVTDEAFIAETLVWPISCLSYE